MKAKANGNSGDFGLTFGLNNQYDTRLGGGLIAFDLTNKRLACHNNVSNIVRYGPELTHVDYSFDATKEYQVDAVVCGELITVYLNDEIALTARLMDMEGNPFAFYSNKASAEITEVHFYE